MKKKSNSIPGDVIDNPPVPINPDEELYQEGIKKLKKEMIPWDKKRREELDKEKLEDLIGARYAKKGGRIDSEKWTPEQIAALKRGYKHGGSVKGDGIAQRGKTRGKYC